MVAKVLKLILGLVIGAAAGFYRAANPRKSNRPHVDAMVGHLLSRGRYPRQE